MKIKMAGTTSTVEPDERSAARLAIATMLMPPVSNTLWLLSDCPLASLSLLSVVRMLVVVGYGMEMYGWTVFRTAVQRGQLKIDGEREQPGLGVLTKSALVKSGSNSRPNS